MISKATTVAAYLEALPEDRRGPMRSLRETILSNLPEGFEECIQYGMISYVVPHSLYPGGYHCDPRQALPFLSIAAQKHYISLYHMGLYQGLLLDWFLQSWPQHSSRKPDMGKSCIRFRKTQDIPFELIGALCRKISPDEWIRHYEAALKA
ncbi:MAG: DUF1801 domain-containing protein [Saprospiraceae bacterium]|jgi:hypothetical protein|nr:DUF1801 domain-containing protein [Saprospiraceae bacterium]MBP9209153.1 DUF1801 domain-containing protein [Saprospiraceae bacterium]MBV6473616.1 hypothetical protein [Saprospiraceae bacterium]